MFDVEYELDQLIRKAQKFNASDIHILPSKDEIQIKLRIDGLLQDIKNISKEYQGQLINRIKIISQMDIGEQRIPQDGRINWHKGDEEISIRT